MCCCRDKKSQTYPVRPHHGMCLAYFKGSGYSSEFRIHMQEMLELFLENATVKLTAATDEICSACPNNENGVCLTEEKVQKYDQAVLKECGLSEGEEVLFEDFARMVQKSVIETGRRVEICGDCQWDNICRVQPSRWKK